MHQEPAAADTKHPWKPERFHQLCAWESLPEVVHLTAVRLRHVVCLIRIRQQLAVSLCPSPLLGCPRHGNHQYEAAFLDLPVLAVAAERS